MIFAIPRHVALTVPIVHHILLPTGLSRQGVYANLAETVEPDLVAQPEAEVL
jgi:hypothetical protein